MRYLTLVLVVYLALDFGNPLTPGTVTFDPDESIDALRTGGIRGHHDLVAAPSIDSARLDLGGDSYQPSARRLSRAHPAVPRPMPSRLLLLRLVESASASDDH